MTSKYEQEPYVQEWVKHMMYYTIPGGKMNRGLSVLHSLASLKGRKLTEEEQFDAHVLGWCVEWLQAFFLISDDIMDASVTRRGQPCYYRSPHPLSHPKVGTQSFCVFFLSLFFLFPRRIRNVRLLETLRSTTASSWSRRFTFC